MDKDNKLIEVANNAALTIQSIYTWVDRVEQSGGASSISGIAACNAMIKSLTKNKERINKLIIDPLLEEIKNSKD